LSTELSNSSPLSRGSSKDAHTLYSLAQASIQSLSGKTPSANNYDNLLVELTEILKLKQDSLIQAALQESLQCGNKDTFNELTTSSEFVASLGPTGSFLKGELLTGYLIAIPLELANYPDTKGSCLTTGSGFYKLEASFQQSGLLPGDDEVSLVNYLYSPDELRTLSFSDVFHLREKLAAQPNSTAIAELPAQDLEQQTAISLVAHKGNKLHIRYLLALVKRKTGQGAPFMESEISGDSDYRQIFEAWRELASKHLLSAMRLSSNLTSQPTALLAVPSLFYDGLREGQVLVNVLLLQQRMGFCLDSKTGGANSIRATLSLRKSDTNVVEAWMALAAKKDGKLLDAFSYELSDCESPGPVLALLKRALFLAGIKDVETV